MIKEAAIRKDGVVYTGRRHNDILGDDSRPFGFLKGGEQGFVTWGGEFLNRFEACAHAIACGQVRAENVSGRLYSEDLY